MGLCVLGGEQAGHPQTLHGPLDVREDAGLRAGLPRSSRGNGGTGDYSRLILGVCVFLM